MIVVSCRLYKRARLVKTPELYIPWCRRTQPNRRRRSCILGSLVRGQTNSIVVVVVVHTLEADVAKVGCHCAKYKRKTTLKNFPEVELCKGKTDTESDERRSHPARSIALYIYLGEDRAVQRKHCRRIRVPILRCAAGPAFGLVCGELPTAGGRADQKSQGNHFK